MSQVIEGLHLEPTSTDKMKDFFYSFFHSQGDPSLQLLIQIYLARQYIKQNTSDTSSLLSGQDDSIKKLVLPAGHASKSLSGEDLTQEFARDSVAGFIWSWEKFKTIVDF